MALIISSVNRVIKVPAKKGFSNKEDLVKEIKANKPVELPDDIAKVYAESYPRIIKLVKSGETPKDEFDVYGFLEKNHPLTKNKLSGVERVNLFKIAEAMGDKVSPNAKNETIVKKILRLNE